MHHQKSKLRASPVFCACVLVVLLLWARAPDAFAHPQFFAEDLAIFWTQWRDLGIASFWTPYGGYLHLTPRVGAFVASLAPHSLQPIAYLTVAIAAAAWTAATIASAHLPRGLGPVLAVLILLIPHDGEVWACLVNVQWVMACALPIVAATRAPRTTAARSNQIIFLAVAGLTGPFSTFMIPLWLARAFRALTDRERYGLIVAAIGMLAGLLQCAFILSSDTLPETPTDPRPLAMAIAFVERFGLDYLSGLGTPLGVVLLLCLALSPVFARGRTLRTAFIVFAVLLMVPTFIKFYRMPDLIISRAVAGRYFYVPSVMLFWTALSLTWIKRPWPMAIGIVSAMLIMTATIQKFKRPARLFFPDWHDNSGDIGHRELIIRYAPGWSIVIPPKSP